MQHYREKIESSTPEPLPIVRELRSTEGGTPGFDFISDKEALGFLRLGFHYQKPRFIGPVDEFGPGQIPSSVVGPHSIDY